MIVITEQHKREAQRLYGQLRRSGRSAAMAKVDASRAIAARHRLMPGPILQAVWGNAEKYPC